jgi:hypothetical protein
MKNNARGCKRTIDETPTLLHKLLDLSETENFRQKDFVVRARILSLSFLFSPISDHHEYGCNRKLSKAFELFYMDEKFHARRFERKENI